MTKGVEKVILWDLGTGRQVGAGREGWRRLRLRDGIGRDLVDTSSLYGMFSELAVHEKDAIRTDASDAS